MTMGKMISDCPLNTSKLKGIDNLQLRSPRQHFKDSLRSSAVLWILGEKQTAGHVNGQMCVGN